MCLLIVLSRIRTEVPLVVGANRDERYDRPSVPMTVLEDGATRILGGRDELAGGTWLAVNDAGVVAGLTNRPVDGGRDPSKRSRGELPLLLARHRSAAEAAATLQAEVDPAAYNPAWILVGDRRSLFAVDVSDQRTVRVEELPPGLHVLENNGFAVDSPKVRHVRSLLSGVEMLSAADATALLVTVLGDHTVPRVSPSEVDEELRPAPIGAACVHTERYGTRWSGLVIVPPEPDRLPELRYADGPACTARFADAGHLWRDERC